jgi:hypothetical protein
VCVFNNYLKGKRMKLLENAVLRQATFQGFDGQIAYFNVLYPAKDGVRTIPLQAYNTKYVAEFLKGLEDAQKYDQPVQLRGPIKAAFFEVEDGKGGTTTELGLEMYQIVDIIPIVEVNPKSNTYKDLLTVKTKGAARLRAVNSAKGGSSVLSFNGWFSVYTGKDEEGNAVNEFHNLKFDVWESKITPINRLQEWADLLSGSGVLVTVEGFQDCVIEKGWGDNAGKDEPTNKFLVNNLTILDTSAKTNSTNTPTTGKRSAAVAVAESAKTVTSEEKAALIRQQILARKVAK